MHPRDLLKKLLPTMAVLALGYIMLLSFLHFQSNAELRRIFGGSAGWSLLKDADRVEAYRIGELPNLHQSDSISKAAVGDYPIISGPIAVSPADIDTLRSTLQDHESYIRKTAKKCMPTPGIRLDFIRGGERLSVLLCFECDMLLNYLNEKLVGGEDFDNARPILVRTARSLFPDDPKIQALAEKR